MSDYLRACRVDEVPENGAVGLDLDGVPVAVVRSECGLNAIHNVCSHAEVALSEGEVEDCEIECWLHGSRFDLTTGHPTGLPATEPVPVYPVKVDGDDVYIDIHHPLNTA